MSSEKSPKDLLMSNSFAKISLQEMLTLCIDDSSPRWEYGWQTLISRYKNYIYKIVHKRCKLWEINKTRLPLSDVVNDIVHDIFIILCQDKSRVLQRFNAKDSEKAFRAYLATISDRITRRNLKKFLYEMLVENPRELADDPVNLEVKWQIYDHIVTQLRESAGKQEHTTERNIMLFNLYVFEDFSAAMIKAVPIFKDVGHRVVDNVINRYRARLKDKI